MVNNRIISTNFRRIFMNKKGSIWGILLIFIGCILIINQVFNIHFLSVDNFWPIFILVPGLIFEFAYFTTGRNPGLLVPGGILTTIGLLFFFETFTNWFFAEYTWPVYILAVAVGLFQLYIFSGRPRGLLVPIFILAAVAVISFAFTILGTLISWFNYSFIGPIILILIGVYILFRNFSNNRNKDI
jgi:hypothetical protein